MRLLVIFPRRIFAILFAHVLPTFDQLTLGVAPVDDSVEAAAAPGDGGDDEDDEEEIPEDLAHLDYDAQQTAIKIRAGWQMFLGTVLVLVFSDPMVDCLAALGERTGIPSFYISFVLAPLASNASELLAAYRFALKKTKATITVSLSQLEGAAISESLSQSAVAPVICGRLPLSVKP